MKAILVIRLEGAFQAWGLRAKWDFRDCADFPTKSGVVGMISAAMGLPRDSQRLGELCGSVRMVVRADRPGKRCTDFHTVSSEAILTAEGKRRSTGTLVTRRDYLQDASFLVLLSGELPVLQELKEALDVPKWPVYLGRKSCVPSVPVIGEVVCGKTVEEILLSWPLADRADSDVLVQTESETGEGLYQTDVRLSDNRHRSFAGRRVLVHKLREQQ